MLIDNDVLIYLLPSADCNWCKVGISCCFCIACLCRYVDLVQNVSCHLLQCHLVNRCRKVGYCLRNDYVDISEYGGTKPAGFEGCDLMQTSLLLFRSDCCYFVGVRCLCHGMDHVASLPIVIITARFP